MWHYRWPIAVPLWQRMAQMAAQGWQAFRVPNGMPQQVQMDSGPVNTQWKGWSSEEIKKKNREGGTTVRLQWVKSSEEEGKVWEKQEQIGKASFPSAHFVFLYKKIHQLHLKKATNLSASEFSLKMICIWMLGSGAHWSTAKTITVWVWQKLSNQ